MFVSVFNDVICSYNYLDTIQEYSRDIPIVKEILTGKGKKTKKSLEKIC